MKNIKYDTKEKILKRAKEAIGIKIKDIDKNSRLSTGKGAIGNIIEESWFDLKVNNEDRPDFEEANVELKVIPYQYNRNGITAKERLVCNIINYMEEYKLTFETSSFMKKCNLMLLMPYEHKWDIDKGEYIINEAVLFSFPLEDLIIIEQDWCKIISKIRNGIAHEISEGDTIYLGACTKGANASSTREQPFSNIPAKQRAFSLKQSYMTYILKNYIFGTSKDENIIKDVSLLKDVGFESYIINKIKPFIGKTLDELCLELNITSKAKNINEIILAKIFDVKGKVTSTEEFQKANIIPKTIRMNSNGSVTESMSFPAFDFIEVASESWEESDFKNMLEQKKFLFVIFRYEDDETLVLSDLMFWNIPESDLDEVGIVWERTSEIIKNGVIIEKIGKRTYNNFPNKSENRVAHVRPHARDKFDTKKLPDGRSMPKQCFWLNNTYISEQIKLNLKN